MYEVVMSGLPAEGRQHIVEEAYPPDAHGPEQDSLAIELGERFESHGITDRKVLHSRERFCRDHAQHVTLNTGCIPFSGTNCRYAGLERAGEYRRRLPL